MSQDLNQTQDQKLFSSPETSIPVRFYRGWNREKYRPLGAGNRLSGFKFLTNKTRPWLGTIKRTTDIDLEEKANIEAERDQLKAEVEKLKHELRRTKVRLQKFALVVKKSR